MEKIQAQKSFATVYLVEFASGKTYVDVTRYGQSPACHIDQLLHNYREVSAIMSAYFSDENGQRPTDLPAPPNQSNLPDVPSRLAFPASLTSPTSTELASSATRSISNLADQMSGPLQISDAREKCGETLFKAAFIRALLTEPYEISVISVIRSAPSSILRPDIEAKYRFVQKVRSFMPFGLNGYNVPGFLHDFRWLVERDAALGALRSFLYPDASSADIVLQAAYFKTLSPRRLRPIIQFIPLEKYCEKTDRERSLAAAVLSSAPDLFRGYKDVLLNESIVYTVPESGTLRLCSVSLSDIFKNKAEAFPVRLRLPYGDTDLFVPWRLYASTSLAKKGIENFMRTRSGIPSALSHAANSDSAASCAVAYGSVWRWLPVGTPDYAQYPELL